MNLETVTLQDCIDMYQTKGRYTIINDGKVTGFKEEIPATDSESEQGL